MNQVPVFPSVRLKQVIRRMARMDEYVAGADLWQEVLTIPQIEQLTNMAMWTFGPSSEVLRSSVFASLSELAGRVLTFKDTRALFRRLFSSDEVLIRGGAITGLAPQVEEAWHFIQVQTVIRSSKGVTLWLKIAYGPAAGVVLKQFVAYSDALLVRLFKACRFPRQWGGFWEHLGQMYFWGLVQSKYGTTGCCRIAVPDRVRELNREVIKERTKPCPNKLSNPCIQCHVGFDRCKAATHAKTKELTDVSADANSA